MFAGLFFRLRGPCSRMASDDDERHATVGAHATRPVDLLGSLLSTRPWYAGSSMLNVAGFSTSRIRPEVKGKD